MCIVSLSFKEIDLKMCQLFQNTSHHKDVYNFVILLNLYKCGKMFANPYIYTSRGFTNMHGVITRTNLSFTENIQPILNVVKISLTLVSVQNSSQILRIFLLFFSEISLMCGNV